MISKLRFLKTGNTALLQQLIEVNGRLEWSTVPTVFYDEPLRQEEIVLHPFSSQPTYEVVKKATPETLRAEFVSVIEYALKVADDSGPSCCVEFLRDWCEGNTNGWQDFQPKL